MHFLGRHEVFKTFGLAQPIHDRKSRRINGPRQPPGALAPLRARDAEAARVVVGQGHFRILRRGRKSAFKTPCVAN